MLRAIIRTKIKDQYNGAEYEGLQTVDIDCPDLENLLNVGGMSENGYHIAELVGVEIIHKPTE